MHTEPQLRFTTHKRHERWCVGDAGECVQAARDCESRAERQQQGGQRDGSGAERHPRVGGEGKLLRWCGSVQERGMVRDQTLTDKMASGKEKKERKVRE